MGVNLNQELLLMPCTLIQLTFLGCIGCFLPLIMYQYELKRGKLSLYLYPNSIESGELGNFFIILR